MTADPMVIVVAMAVVVLSLVTLAALYGAVGELERSRDELVELGHSRR